MARQARASARRRPTIATVKSGQRPCSDVRECLHSPGSHPRRHREDQATTPSGRTSDPCREPVRLKPDSGCIKAAGPHDPSPNGGGVRVRPLGVTARRRRSIRATPAALLPPAWHTRLHPSVAGSQEPARHPPLAFDALHCSMAAAGRPRMGRECAVPAVTWFRH